MKKVKITVLKTTLYKELTAEYGAEGLGLCPMMKSGQVFYADYAKPEDFRDEAWKAIYSMFLRWRTGPETACFIIKKPGVSICSRNNGLRPVIFKLEATDEESKINYTPVRR